MADFSLIIDPSEGDPLTLETYRLTDGRTLRRIGVVELEHRSTGAKIVVPMLQDEAGRTYAIRLIADEKRFELTEFNPIDYPQLADGEELLPQETN